MNLSGDGNTYIELSFAPSYALVSIVRRFLGAFFELSLRDPASSDLLAMSVHELLENAVKFSNDGVSTIRLDMEKDSDSKTPKEIKRVVVTTRNQGSNEDIATLSDLFQLRDKCPNAMDFYIKLMERNSSSDRAQLGIGRVCAEAGMDVGFSVENDTTVVIRAVLELHEQEQGS